MFYLLPNNHTNIFCLYVFLLRNHTFTFSLQNRNPTLSCAMLQSVSWIYWTTPPHHLLKMHICMRCVLKSCFVLLDIFLSINFFGVSADISAEYLLNSLAVQYTGVLELCVKRCVWRETCQAASLVEGWGALFSCKSGWIEMSLLLAA